MNAEEIISEMHARAIFDAALTREEYIQRVAERLSECDSHVQLEIGSVTAEQLVEAMRAVGVALPRVRKFS